MQIVMGGFTMQVGKIYKYNEDGAFGKVKINYISSIEQLKVSNDSQEELRSIHFEFVGSYRKGEVESINIDEFIDCSEELKRETHCWLSKQHKLSELKEDICTHCGWIICPIDGSCKCNKPV